MAPIGGESDEHHEAGTVTAGRVAQAGDEHRHQRFSHAVGGQHDAHHAAHDRDAVQLRGHQRNDHVVAAEPNPEHKREHLQRRRRRRIEQRRNRRRDDHVDQDHHALLRHAIGQPSHEQPADEAADQDQRQRRVDVHLRELAIEAQIQRQVLHRPADRADRRHAADEQQEKCGTRQDRARAIVAAAARARGGGRRRLAHEIRRRQRDHDHQHAEPPQRAAPPEALRQGVREQRHQRAADADAEVGDAHRLAAALVEPSRQQHLVRQRPAAHVTERVERVEQVEGAQRGGIGEARPARARPSRCRRASAGAVRTDRPCGRR